MVPENSTIGRFDRRRYRVRVSVVLLALAITALSLLGGLAPRAFSQRLSSSQLETITGIASGLLLASALMVVIPEGFHTAAAAGARVESIDDDHDDEVEFAHDEEAPLDLDGDVFAFDPALLGLTVLGGFVAMLLLEGFGVGHAVHEEHHDHVDGHGHSHVHHPTSISVLAAGLSVHALADGLAIGSAVIAGDTAFSLLVAFAVLLHRVPAAFSLGLFALHETEDGPAAFRGLLAFSLATPLAMIVSVLALDGLDEKYVALTLLFSAGTFVYVATVDTLPAIHNPETGRRSVRNVIIGIAIFALLLFLANSTGALDHGH